MSPAGLSPTLMRLLSYYIQKLVSLVPGNAGTLIKSTQDNLLERNIVTTHSILENCLDCYDDASTLDLCRNKVSLVPGNVIVSGS